MLKYGSLKQAGIVRHPRRPCTSEYIYTATYGIYIARRGGWVLADKLFLWLNRSWIPCIAPVKLFAYEGSELGSTGVVQAIELLSIVNTVNNVTSPHESPPEQ